MAIIINTELLQGTEEWVQARCGMLTASEIKNIITPKTLKYAQNDKERSHVYELAAQRINGFVEPHYTSDDMLRGEQHEKHARDKYSETYQPVTEAGFITNDRFGFMLGFSPDGLVGDDGIIEIKCPRMKKQVEAIATDTMPEEYMIQVQSALLISERRWCDYVSFYGGMPMFVKRIVPDIAVQEAIVAAVLEFNSRLDATVNSYNQKFGNFPKTEPVIEPESEIVI